MLRDGLLEAVTIVVAGDAPEIGAACAALGAHATPLHADVQDEDAVAAAVALLPAPDVLVCATGELDGAFIAARAVAASWIAAERGGRIVLIAPRRGGPVRAALENLARTLSIEWSRHGITPTAILPGDEASDSDVAELVAFLASPAGGYYSGCALTLR